MRRSDREAAISKVPRRPTLVSSTMESLKAFLTEQGFEIGDRLPSQDALVRSLGVSRTVVREAVKGLEMLGIVRSSHGEGVFFTGFDAKPLADGLIFGTEAMPLKQRISNLFEARRILEVGAVEFVVERMTQKDQAEMEVILSDMWSKASEGGDYLVLDYAFHRALVQSAHNEIVNRLGNLLEEVFFLLSSHAEYTVDDDLSEIARQHQHLYEAILTRDVNVAQDAMKQHLDNSRKQWLAALDNA